MGLATCRYARVVRVREKHTMTDNSIVHQTSSNRAHLIDLFLFKGHPVNIDQDRQVQILVNQGLCGGLLSCSTAATLGWVPSGGL